MRAAAVALPVDGAGLSLHDEGGLRFPLAASSEIAAAAERLEFTAGCGPCLAAAGSALPLFATERLLADRWPIFHDLLVTRTALRSVLALPLPGGFGGVGAIALYFRDPAGPAAVHDGEARRLAGVVAGQLEAVSERPAGTDPVAQSWLDTPAARRRDRLWTAVGMVIATLQVAAADALALLRGHTYATDRTVDDLADEFLEHRMEPEELRGRPPGPRTRPGDPPDSRPGRAGQAAQLYGTDGGAEELVQHRSHPQGRRVDAEADG